MSYILLILLVLSLTVMVIIINRTHKKNKDLQDKIDNLEIEKNDC